MKIRLKKLNLPLLTATSSLIVIFLCSYYIFGDAILPARCEPISLGVAVGSAALMTASLAGYDFVKCSLYECCRKNWINFNATGLKAELNKRLYGQHLVINTVVRALKAHLGNENPSKALVLSFHGPTGSGKNYVSKIIADHLYKKGLYGSQYAHLILPDVHFPTEMDGDSEKIEQLATRLRKEIIKNVTLCDRSLFLFDEVDKISPRIINAIKPFIDHHKFIDNVDFSKSIFIFMSNTGATDITKKTFEYLREGKLRNDVTLNDLEPVIIKAAFNEHGGLRYSDLIKSNLIDHFLPFLPLERRHVKLCIEDYLASYKKRDKNFRLLFNDSSAEQNFIAEIADNLQYGDSSLKLFVSSGCKRLAPKIDIEIEREKEKLDDESAATIKNIDELK